MSILTFDYSFLMRNDVENKYYCKDQSKIIYLNDYEKDI